MKQKEAEKFAGLHQVKGNRHASEFFLTIVGGLIAICLLIITSISLSSNYTLDFSDELTWSLICSIIAVPFLSAVIWIYRGIDIDNISYLPKLRFPKVDFMWVAWVIGALSAGGALIFLLKHIDDLLCIIFLIAGALGFALALLGEKQIERANLRGKQIVEDSED